MNNLWNILKKELRELFRDKKSLAMMLIIPIFIPLIMIGMSALFEMQANKDVEEWEYSAIYDVFNMNLFEEEGFEIEEVEDEYNPTYLVKFKYEDNREYISEKLALCIDLIEEAMEKAFSDIEGKEEEYN